MQGNKKILRAIIIALALVFLYLPIATLVVYSFNESKMVTKIGRASCRERV